MGLELLESEVGDDEDEVMEDNLQPVQGIPEAAWESLRGLKDSKYTSTNNQLDGETWTGEVRDKEVSSDTQGEAREGRTKGL